MNASKKLYLKQFIPAMILYAAFIAASSWLLRGGIKAWWRIPVAISPMLPTLLVLRSVVGFYSRCDELEARINLHALAFAFGGTAILTLTYGFLQTVGFPDVNWIWVWPIMGIFWIVGSWIAKRKYR